MVSLEIIIYNHYLVIKLYKNIDNYIYIYLYIYIYIYIYNIIFKMYYIYKIKYYKVNISRPK